MESPRSAGPPRDLTDDDYRALAQMRHGQRRFAHWSTQEAAGAGLTAAQHQMLLGIRAWSGEPAGPTIGDIAEFMFIRHNSAVELIDRAERAGLVARTPGPEGSGRVIVQLTADGADRLRALTESHLRELRELAPTMSALWAVVARVARDGAVSA